MEAAEKEAAQMVAKKAAVGRVLVPSEAAMEVVSVAVGTALEAEAMGVAVERVVVDSAVAM